MVLAFDLPADLQCSEVVVPAVRPLDHPTPRPPLHAADERLLAATTNVRGDASTTNCLLGIPIVESLIEAQILGPTRSTTSSNTDSIQRRLNEAFVVHVRTSDHDANRDAFRVGEDTAFDARFSAVRGVRPREVPPFGALAMAPSNEHQRRSNPRTWW